MTARDNKSFKLNPTITLFGVNPARVNELYEQGYFETMVLPHPGERIAGTSLDSSKILSTSFSNDTDHNLHTIRDRSGCEMVVAAVGIGTEGKEVRCHYCRRDFTYHDHDAPGIVMNKINQRDDEGRIYITLQVDGLFDSFSCALAYLRDNPSQYQRYSSAKADTLAWFQICHPDVEELVMAKDWRLLDINGGPLDDKAWEDTTFRYIPQPNVRVTRTSRAMIRDKIATKTN